MMVQTTAIEAIRVKDCSVSLTEVLSLLHRQGRLLEALRTAGIRRVVRKAAEELGVRPSVPQLQISADGFRRTKGLLTSVKMHEWLESRRLSVIDFEAMIEDDLVNRIVFKAVTQDARRVFEATPRKWDVISLTLLEVSSEGLAFELKTQLLEDGLSVSDLLKENRIEEAGLEQSRSIQVFRGHPASELPLALENSQSGEVIGPVSSRKGWVLARVEAVKPAEFDQHTESTIRKTLFSQWLNTKIPDDSLSFPLLDLISCCNDY